MADNTGGGGWGDWFGGLGSALGTAGTNFGNTAANWGGNLGNWFMNSNYGPMQNPNAYVSGAGSLAGLGSNIYATLLAQQQNRALQDYGRTARAGQTATLNQLTDLSNRPLDPNAFYQPMTDAARTAYIRQVNADAVAQGRPMQGQNAMNLAAESLAGNETQRFQYAQAQAQQLRQQQQAALQGQLGYYGTWNNPQLSALMNQRPITAMGDISAFPNYLAQQQLQQTQQQQQQQNQSNYNRMFNYMDRFQPNPSVGGGSPYGTSGVPGLILRPGAQTSDQGFNFWGNPNQPNANPNGTTSLSANQTPGPAYGGNNNMLGTSNYDYGAMTPPPF